MHETHGFSVADAASQVNPDEGPPPESSAPRHFPGTEPIEGDAAAIPPAEDVPAEKKPSWAERRAARKAAAASTSESSPEDAGATPNPNPRKLRLPWDVRVKIAVVLSFVILVTVLVVNKKSGKGKDAGKGAQGVPLAIGDKPAKPTESPKDGTGDAPKQEPAPAPPKEEPKAPAVADKGEKQPPDPVPPDPVPPDPAVKEVAQNAETRDVAPAPEPPPPVPTTPAAAATPEPAPAIADAPPAPDKSQEKDKPAEPPADAPPPIGEKPVESPPPIDKPAETPPPTPAPELRPDAPPTLDASREKPATPSPSEPLATPPPAPVATPAPAPPPTPNPAEPAAPAAMPSLSPTPPVAEAPAAPPAQAAPDLGPGGGFPIPNASSRRTTLVVAGTAEAPSRPAPRSSASESDGDDTTIHVVRRNENFWTISRYYYGSGRFYKALWEANRKQVPAIDDLYIGTPIRIPAVENLNRGLIDPIRTAKAGGPRSADSGRRGEAGRDAKAERASTRTSELMMLPVADASTQTRSRGTGIPIRRTPPKTEPIYRTHVVRGKYETLRSIARDELGDAEREDEILEMNRDLIEEGSSRVPVGTALKIPEDTRRK